MILRRRKRQVTDRATLRLSEGNQKTFELKGPDVNDVISRSFKMLEEKYGAINGKKRPNPRRR